MSGIASSVLDTACVSAHERFSLWRESLSATHEVALPDGGDPANFDAVARGWKLGQSLIIETRSTAQQLWRTPHTIRADQIDHYIVRLQRRGTWIGDCNGRAVGVGASQVMVLDMARPTAACLTEVENVNILLPRDMFDEVLTPFYMHGLVIGGAMAAILGNHLASLSANLSQIHHVDARKLSEATCRLVAACVAPSRETFICAEEPLNVARFALIRRYVDRHLYSPELSPESICKALGLSRSTLYAVCEPLGGVTAFIQRRRLERAYAVLANPRDCRRISQIAYQHGFVSEAHFSRVFRRAFGCSPSQAREAGRLPPPMREDATSISYEAAYKNWIRQLCG